MLLPLESPTSFHLSSTVDALSNEQTRIDTLKCGGGDHQNFPTRNSDILFPPVEKTLDAKTPGLSSNFQTLWSKNFVWVSRTSL